MKYDLTGQRFGRLVVVGLERNPKSGNRDWKCLCECGATKLVTSGTLRAGKAKSCGCMAKSRLGRVKDISGERYGRLVIDSYAGSTGTRGSFWNATCDCGTKIKVRKSNLWVDSEGKKNTVSCGCHKADYQRLKHETHGEMTGTGKAKSKEYDCWQNMKARCYKKTHPRYKSYGAKGVKICDEWFDDFAQFLADVGRAPEDKPYIDRIDPYGNYEPSNVRWVDFATSNANKR